MGDEAVTVAPVDALAVSQQAVSSEIQPSSLSLSQPDSVAEAVEPPKVNGDGTELPKDDEETAGKQAITEVTAPEPDGEGTTEVTEAPSAVAGANEAESTPASNKKEKRKSVGGVPEHKGKKLNKKKSMPTLHLDCKPGDFYWARLKGHPPWPALICDEAMLPESLLGTRPVSTARPDGTIRDDFQEGGKNAKERTYPVMFLATNEFAWMVNTALTPLDPEECKSPPPAKMIKDLKTAWKLASENHDLNYFKGILKAFEEEQAQIEKEIAEEREREAARAEEQARLDAEEAERAAADDAQPKKKSKSRKSKGGDDIEMEDADAPKSSKKRKKETESDADGSKPKKTPKVTKLNAPKTPNGASGSQSAKASKKKIVQAPKEEDEEEKPQMTEAERMAHREKAVLYLRHRLQKGFLSRDQAPKEDEMDAMNDFFNQLEVHENLEPSIIRNTKVHKVLKAIVKLSSIPKDEEYHFKKRSAARLEIWNKRMEVDGDPEPKSAMEPKSTGFGEDKQTPETNGEKQVETLVSGPVEPKDEGETKEGAEKEVEEKADEAAEKLDAKVEPAPEDKMEVDPPAEQVEKTVPVIDAADQATEGEAVKEPTDGAVAVTAEAA